MSEPNRTGGTVRERLRVSEQSNLGRGQFPILHYGGAFAIRVIPSRDHVIVVELFGELDVVSMERFEGTVAEVLSGHPSELLFDLTQSEFVCAQGYSVIGRCSAQVKVAVRSRTELSARVLALYGYEDVMVLTEPEALRHAPS